MIGIILFGIEVIQGDGLVADHAAGSILGRGIDSMGVQIRLGANDEMPDLCPKVGGLDISDL
jgi:hypothetical protein